jgi:hypothetical protein
MEEVDKAGGLDMAEGVPLGVALAVMDAVVDDPATMVEVDETVTSGVLSPVVEEG